MDLNTSSEHCGGCTRACSKVGGNATCKDGVCGIDCGAPHADCNGLPDDGCEVNLDTTVTDCGACGKVCDSTNGTAQCSGGVCGISCNAGFASCDKDPSNGCEVDLKNDENNCSTCGKVCNSINGTPFCSAGECGILCNAGFADCDAKVANGCEVDTRTDGTNCGACGQICSAQETCSNGGCNIGVCPSNMGNCDGKAENGCETNISSSATDCGSCGTVCQATNTAMTTCAAGVCSPTCKPGFGNCDMNGANGCESDLLASVTSCGACGVACVPGNASSSSCLAGVCTPVCNAGYGDCDGKGSNGCETNTSTGVSAGGQVANCGSCGTICTVSNGAARCDNGTCGLQTCSAPYADCDGSYATGCESDTSSDVNNCGGCGNKCSSANGTATCTKGVCGIICAAGFADCDGQAANGCESNPLTDPSNCGHCQLACPSGYTCEWGHCCSGKICF